MSYEAFRKKFLWETGESPGQFCSHLKIEIAKQLLIATDWKLYAIAQECGYHNESAFVHAFKKAVGITPIQYRKENSG